MALTASQIRTEKSRSLSQSSGDNVDSTGKFLKFDVREDEEQLVKLQEIIDLLVAGGYFRARIKGVDHFDKIVGGMSWAIEMCNVDLDVDILFRENLTIGQKISLTEKIVKVLQKMKCPHQLEPHQIQGMDCIHIFPVIQWLVKKSIETRKQMHDYIKSYSTWQFSKFHNQSNKQEIDAQTKELIDSDLFKHPKRRFRHPARDKIVDEGKRVKTTLLEYGYNIAGQFVDDKNIAGDSNDSNEDAKELEKLLKIEQSTNRISAALVGTIVESQSDEIQKLAREYSKNLVNQIERPDHKELLLRKKIELIKKELTACQQRDEETNNKISTIKEQIDFIKEKQTSIKSEFEQIDEIKNEKEIEEKKNLSHILESLKRQKTEFKAHCREEKMRLEKEIEEMMKQSDNEDDEGEIETELVAQRDKHSKVKLQLGLKSKEIAKLQRRLDDIPSRAELSQYQKRFIELYNQVAAKHNETKKFYNLYNTLDDERMYLEKEFNLINSVIENFNHAMASTSGKEQFLLQFEQIVEGIKQTKLKVETRRQNEKMKRDQLNETYLDLIEKQRLYYKAVKDFKEECKKNELLISKLQNQKNQ